MFMELISTWRVPLGSPWQRSKKEDLYQRSSDTAQKFIYKKILVKWALEEECANDMGNVTHSPLHPEPCPVLSA